MKNKEFNIINMKNYNLRLLVVLTLVFSLTAGICTAQMYQSKTPQKKSDFKWPRGKKMGLSLTFDDARLSQIDKGIPLLDKYGVKGTFYLSPDAMVQRLDGWKKAVKNGHDIGNHSLVHPCTGNFDWSRDKALENYTLMDMNSELDSSINVIQAALGVRPLSFAFPCGQTYVGRGSITSSYVPIISAKFEFRDTGNHPLCPVKELLK